MQQLQVGERQAILTDNDYRVTFSHTPGLGLDINGQLSEKSTGQPTITTVYGNNIPLLGQWLSELPHEHGEEEMSDAFHIEGEDYVDEEGNNSDESIRRAWIEIPHLITTREVRLHTDTSESQRDPHRVLNAAHDLINSKLSMATYEVRDKDDNKLLIPTPAALRLGEWMLAGLKISPHLSN